MHNVPFADRVVTTATLSKFSGPDHFSKMSLNDLKVYGLPLRECEQQKEHIHL